MNPTQLNSLTMTDSEFTPHVTVATVVEREGKFLFVEEFNRNGEIVINQPAGHLEAGETLIEAAVRETYEETGWRVSITGLLSLGLYTSPHNQVTYHRSTFIGAPLSHDASAKLDDGIHRAVWLSHQELIAKNNLRSPMVSKAVEQYLTQNHYPLDLISDCIP